MLNPIKALLQILTFKLAFGKTLKCKVQLLFAHIYTTNSVIHCKVYSLLPHQPAKNNIIVWPIISYKIVV